MKRRSTVAAVSQGMRALLLLLALLLAFAGCNTTEPPMETLPSEENSTAEETTTLEETTETEEEKTTAEETTTEEESTTEEETKSIFEPPWEKQYCKATIEDRFAGDKILIVVMPFANYTEYSVEDFAYIGCTSIRDLWTDIEPNKLCRIILLNLDQNSKQNVLDMIKILEQREDVFSAEPSYYGTWDSLING